MPKLTQSRLKELLHYDPDTGVFTWIKKSSRFSNNVVGSIAGSINSEGYRHIHIDRKNHKAHRLAWLYVFGGFPNGIIDHVNRNKLDNRLRNLREANYSSNNQNHRISKRNTSGITGVYWYKPTQKWCAKASIGGALRHIGYFETIEEAIAARKTAEKEFYSLPD
jgi:hypothetical protein